MGRNWWTQICSEAEEPPQGGGQPVGEVLALCALQAGWTGGEQSKANNRWPGFHQWGGGGGQVPFLWLELLANALQVSSSMKWAYILMPYSVWGMAWGPAWMVHGNVRSKAWLSTWFSLTLVFAVIPSLYKIRNPPVRSPSLCQNLSWRTWVKFFPSHCSPLLCSVDVPRLCICLPGDCSHFGAVRNNAM